MRKNVPEKLLLNNVMWRLRRVFIRRTYKDRLFVKLFQDKPALLQLYNALNHSNYTNPDDLKITTIDDVVYLGMKNDCSFIIGNYLNLYEQQSTFCPNMPIRGLIYLMDIYQAYIAEHHLNLHGSKLITLPAPKYIVFYNGTKPRPDIEQLYLSSAFKGDSSCLEFVATVYNINQGHNQELLEQCRTLEGYSILIDKIREYQSRGLALSEAVDAACVYCIDHDVLKAFLLKHRNEVTRVLLTEYDPKKQRKLDIRDAREDGATLKLISQIRKKMQRGQTVEKIAEDLLEDESRVAEISACISEEPDAEDGRILEMLEEIRIGQRKL